MPVFVGNSGLKKILGVTKQSQDQWNPQASDSIFHSSMPYLQLEEFNLTNWSWMTLPPTSVFGYANQNRNYYVGDKIARCSELTQSGNSNVLDGVLYCDWELYKFNLTEYRFQKFTLPDYAKSLLRQKTPYFLVYKWSDGYTQMVQPRQPLIYLNQGSWVWGEAQSTQQDLLSTGLDEYTAQLNLTSSQEYLLVGERRPSYDRGRNGTPYPQRTLSDVIVTSVQLYFTKNLTVSGQGDFQFSSLNPQESGEVLISNSAIRIAGQDLMQNKYLQVYSAPASLQPATFPRDTQVSNIFAGGVTQPQQQTLDHHQYYGESWCDEYSVGMPWGQNSASKRTLHITTDRMFQFTPAEGVIPFCCGGYSGSSTGSPDSDLPLAPNKTSRMIFPTPLGGNYLQVKVAFDVYNVYTKPDFLSDRQFTKLGGNQRQPLVHVLHGGSEVGVSFSSVPGSQGIQAGGRQLFSEKAKLFCRVGATRRIRVPRMVWGYTGQDGSGVQYAGTRKTPIYSFSIDPNDASTNIFVISMLPLTQQDFSIGTDRYSQAQYTNPAQQLHQWSYKGGVGFYPGFWKTPQLDSYLGITTQLADGSVFNINNFIDKAQNGTTPQTQGHHLGLIDLPVGYSYILTYNMTNSYRVDHGGNPARYYFYCKGAQEAMITLERVSATEFVVYAVDTYSPSNYLQQGSDSQQRPFYPSLFYSQGLFSVAIQPLL